MKGITMKKHININYFLIAFMMGFLATENTFSAAVQEPSQMSDDIIVFTCPHCQCEGIKAHLHKTTKNIKKCPECGIKISFNIEDANQTPKQIGLEASITRIRFISIGKEETTKHYVMFKCPHCKQDMTGLLHMLDLNKITYQSCLGCKGPIFFNGTHGSYKVESGKINTNEEFEFTCIACKEKNSITYIIDEVFNGSSIFAPRCPNCKADGKSVLPLIPIELVKNLSRADLTATKS
jgi:hypothetical protein